jgi:hypothetical protein
MAVIGHSLTSATLTTLRSIPKSIFLLLLEEAPQVVLGLGVVPCSGDYIKKKHSHKFFFHNELKDLQNDTL